MNIREFLLEDCKQNNPQWSRKQKYLFMGRILHDGDKFEVQEEKAGENTYNPSGIGIYTFHHKNYTGWKKV